MHITGARESGAESSRRSRAGEEHGVECDSLEEHCAADSAGNKHRAGVVLHEKGRTAKSETGNSPMGGFPTRSVGLAGLVAEGRNRFGIDREGARLRIARG